MPSRPGRVSSQFMNKSRKINRIIGVYHCIKARLYLALSNE